MIYKQKVINMFTIRPIELKDIEIIFNHTCQLAQRSGSKSPDFLLTKEKLIEDLFGDFADWYGLIIENKDKILGSCLYSFANTNRAFNRTKCMFLDILFVDQQHRRKKLGKKLMDELKNIALSKDITRIEFWCTKDNIESHEFYKTIGAEKINLLDVYNLNLSN